MPKPTIARTVLAVGGAARSNGADVAPAVITRVWSEDKDLGRWTVNLTVFPDAQQPKVASSVYLYADEQAARDNLAYESVTAAFWPTIS